MLPSESGSLSSQMCRGTDIGALNTALKDIARIFTLNLSNQKGENADVRDDEVGSRKRSEDAR